VPSPPPGDLTPAAAAFGPFLVADITRLLLAAVGVFMVLLCLRVAWMRAKAPQGSPLRERSPWALLSYACFCAIPTGHALDNLGQPPDMLLILPFAAALFSGLFAAFGQVTIRLWTQAPPPAPDPAHKEPR
jgi:uncharacterized membrane protein YfcA